MVRCTEAQFSEHRGKCPRELSAPTGKVSNYDALAHPHPAWLEGAHVTDYSVYFAHQRTVQTIHGLAIRYRLALVGPAVAVTHSDLDRTLPEYSVRITTGGDELVVRSADWVDRRGELETYVLAWLLERLDLRAAKPRAGARRYDETWMRAWRGLVRG